MNSLQTIQKFIDEVKVLDEQATAGPWSTLGTEKEIPMVWDNSNDAIVFQKSASLWPYFEPEDALFIAYARTALPKAVKLIEILSEALKDVIDYCEECNWACPICDRDTTQMKDTDLYSAAKDGLKQAALILEESK